MDGPVTDRCLDTGSSDHGRGPKQSPTQEASIPRFEVPSFQKIMDVDRRRGTQSHQTFPSASIVGNWVRLADYQEGPIFWVRAWSL